MSKFRSLLPLYNFISYRKYADGGSGGTGMKGLVLGAYDGCNPGELFFSRVAKQIDEGIGGKISELVKGGAGISRGTAQVFSNIGNDFYSVAIAGLGPETAGFNTFEMLDECKENIRWAAGTGARALQETGFRRENEKKAAGTYSLVSLPQLVIYRGYCGAEGISNIFVEAFGNAEAAAEGANLSTWLYQDMTSPQDQKPKPKVELYHSDDTQGWQVGIIKSDCQNLARRLEEAPANFMTPTIFAQWAIDVLCPCGVQAEVHDRDWLETHKMNAFLSITKGSCEQPLLLELGYCGAKPEDRPLVFIGKGVTFDTGGICLKECKGMADKRGDLAGAAVCVALIKCVAQLVLPINIRAVIPLMESMIGGSAIKPGDVVTSMNGKTIQVENPDNEGRVMMVDPMLFSAAEHFPCLLTTVAALNTTSTLGLGSACSPAFSTSNDVYRELERAGSESGDRVWRFPFWKYYKHKVTDYTSVDVNNVGKGLGQTCLGAAFLKEFVDPKLDFLHVDIHGTGLRMRGNNFPYLKSGLMTGRPVRTLAQFVYQIACPHDKGDDCGP